MEVYYTGIGSRKDVPRKVLKQILNIGYNLALKGFILRSGAADGCDKQFELGCDQGNGKKEIYLPWKNFNNHSSELYTPTAKAEEMAFKWHPNLYAQKDSVIKLMSRNSHQVLGLSCKTPSNFLVCYCPVDDQGNWVGGTGQALRVYSGEVKKHKIFNLFFEEQYEELKKYIKAIDEGNEN